MADIPARARDAHPRGLREWWRFGRTVLRETLADHVLLLAAGVAFFAFISLFPALIAIGLMHRLISGPGQASAEIEAISDVLPEDAGELVVGQLELLDVASDRSLGIGLVVALLVALWGASTATSNMIAAVNAMYDHTLQRSFVRRRALALLMTLGGVAVVAVAMAVIAVVPRVVAMLDMPSWLVSVIGVGRWAGLVLAFAVALAFLYRFAPFRGGTGFRLVSLGTVAGTTVWIAASVGLSVYVHRFADYKSTYGHLVGVIVLLLWLWLAAFAALFGAGVNAEVERRAQVRGSDETHDQESTRLEG